MPETASYRFYWGKAQAEHINENPYHLLICHSLDVAAVGSRLLERHASIRQTLTQLTQLPPDILQAGLPLFLALHDLGKFSYTFQALRPDLILQADQPSQMDGAKQRHDRMGYAAWQNILKPHWTKTGVLSQKASRFDAVMQAMTGHHGKPPSSEKLVIDRYFSGQDQQAICEFADALLTLFPAFQPSIAQWQTKALKHASWWIAGFGILSDWLGSNRDHFTYHTHIESLSGYWKTACQQADQAIDHSELIPANPSDKLTLEQFFQSAPNAIQATPLQQQAQDIPLGDAQQLFILEDVTGAGKTEAALILAHRLIARGQADGLYFGLPTMATADAMYQRIGAIYRHFYMPDTAPSLVLAHGARELSAQFRQSVMQIPERSEQQYADAHTEEAPASQHCAAWLADNRKKALLAEIGTGTIDQALLAILPNRHQALRMLGLSRKVLIIDEVHAYDAYMFDLLDALLKAHVKAGGSAILLSATLPQEQRQKLLRSFARAMNVKPEIPTAMDYPLLTHFDGQQIQAHPVATRPSVKRRVQIDFAHDIATLDARIAEWLEQGQCICWINNTVKDALATYQRLREKHAEHIELFHARYCLQDRLEIEERVLQQFGRDSTATERRGRLLIATQVVEQSLDLDFDQMITDLAPIDLIIQRAGRLHRHQRDQQGNRLSADDQRAAPVLTIHAPEWTEQPEENWYADAFPNSVKIYIDHAQLWLGMRLLREHGAFNMPEDARRLIEGVYEEEELHGLLEARNLAWADQQVKKSVSKLNQIKLEKGYTDNTDIPWSDEINTPTRLQEEETTTLWLALWHEGQLQPLHNIGHYAWQKSSLNVQNRYIQTCQTHSDIPEEILATCVESLPGKGKWGKLLSLEKTAQTGEYLFAGGQVKYSQSLGLLVEQTPA